MMSPTAVRLRAVQPLLSLGAMRFRSGIVFVTISGLLLLD